MQSTNQFYNTMTDIISMTATHFDSLLIVMQHFIINQNILHVQLQD